MAELGRKTMRVSWGLLGEWHCVPIDMTHDEGRAFVLSLLAESVAGHTDLITDRLFGGFHCAEDPNRRHVYFATGHYTYTRPEANTALSGEDRLSVWKDLIAENRDQLHDHPKGPFCEDFPGLPTEVA